MKRKIIDMNECGSEKSDNTEANKNLNDYSDITANKSMNEYSYIVKRAFRTAMGVDEDDSSVDEEIADYAPTEIFDMVCDYEGLIGYGNTIRNWIADIYGIYLEDM